MDQEPNKGNRGGQGPDDRNRQGGPGGQKPTLQPRMGRQLLIWAFIVVSVIVIASFFQNLGAKRVKAASQGEFQQFLAGGAIEKVKITGTTIRADLKEGTAKFEQIKLSMPEEWIATHIDAIRKQVDGEAVSWEPENNLLVLIVANALPVLILVFLLWWMFNRQMRSMSASAENFPFAKSRVHYAHLERPEVTFNDVAGIEEAKQEVKEIVDFLKFPEKYRRIGGRIPRGILLVGHPGTGKTLLAKAIAGEANVPFFSLCGSDFVELFVGVGASRVRDLFKQARENQPSIIFLDEIDAVGRRRGTGLGGGHDEREQTLNAILSEMDGFRRDDGVILIAATNRPDVLDPALLRPGRFDREIVVDLPDVVGREAILKVHAKKVKLGGDVDLVVLGRGTPGFSGAELEAVVNEAAIIAATRGKDAIAMEDLEEARDKVRFGRQKTSRVMSDADRRLTAFHEAGHALAAHLLTTVEPLHKVTIIPRGAALGMTMILPERDRYGIRRNEAMGQITMSLAGRVAEEMFCGDVSSGAEADIEASTELARRMVCRWGMSEKLGPLSYSGKEEHLFLGREITRTEHTSEATAQIVDGEVKRIITACYDDARRLLEQNKELLPKIVEALLKHETLDRNDVQTIIAGGVIQRPGAIRRIAAAGKSAGPEAKPEERPEGRLDGPGRAPKPESAPGC